MSVYYFKSKTGMRTTSHMIHATKAYNQGYNKNVFVSTYQGDEVYLLLGSNKIMNIIQYIFFFENSVLEEFYTCIK